MWLAALGAQDPERGRIVEQNTHHVRELIGHGIPKFVQRSLVSFGFRLAQGIARDGAPTHGFEPMSSRMSFAYSSAPSRRARP